MFMLLSAYQEPVEGKLICDECVKLVDKIEDAGVQEIDKLLDKVCDLFTDPAAQQDCDQFVNDEFELIFEWIQDDYPSSYLCTLMKLCDTPKPDVDNKCEGCQIVFQMLEDMWNYGPTMDLFEQVLDVICRILPSSLQQDCDVYVNYEFEDIVAWVENQYSPQYICTIVNACDFPINPVDDGMCLFCEEAIKLLYDAFDFGTIDDEEYVKQILDYVCYIFPEDSTNRQYCDEFINQEYDELVSYIINEFPPENCCILAGACESDIDPTYSSDCEFCHIIYQFFLDLLDFEATEEDVEALLNHVCEIVPETMQNACDVLVDKEYEKLINNLVNKHPTDEACVNMNYCEA